MTNGWHPVIDGPVQHPKRDTPSIQHPLDVAEPGAAADNGYAQADEETSASRRDQATNESNRSVG